MKYYCHIEKEARKRRKETIYKSGGMLMSMRGGME
jgi:hypothetical protein